MTKLHLTTVYNCLVNNKGSVCPCCGAKFDGFNFMGCDSGSPNTDSYLDCDPWVADPQLPPPTTGCGHWSDLMVTLLRGVKNSGADNARADLINDIGRDTVTFLDDLAGRLNDDYGFDVDGGQPANPSSDDYHYRKMWANVVGVSLVDD
jgi:hypothetical protein